MKAKELDLFWCLIAIGAVIACGTLLEKLTPNKINLYCQEDKYDSFNYVNDTGLRILKTKIEYNNLAHMNVYLVSDAKFDFIIYNISDDLSMIKEIILCKNVTTCNTGFNISKFQNLQIMIRRYEESSIEGCYGFLTEANFFNPPGLHDSYTYY